MRHRHLQWLPVRRGTPRRATPHFGVAAVAGEEVAITGEALPAHDPRLTPRDEATFLLHTAAEIEHALMVQYLYAAYSLLDTPPAGPEVPADAGQLLTSWQASILQVAREEMGHLLAVENLLRFIGGPLSLDREDFPFRSEFYPFRFKLEPLSKRVLAKYVAAEMPENAADPEIPRIIEIAREIAGMEVNRVGALYDAIIKLFATELRDEDFSPDTAGEEGLQARREDWRGSDVILVRQVASRDEAVAVLRAVAEQGEGAGQPQAPGQRSHYDRFLEIFRQFPESGWNPTRPVPTDPNTSSPGDQDELLAGGRITNQNTRLWAQLFNLRYRMLLADLSHALHLPGPAPRGGAGPRSQLRDWTFAEMRGRGFEAGLSNLARKLMTLPQHEESTGSPFAGPPFELPYTLELPDRERDRWRLHGDLIELSGILIGEIEPGGADPILDELKAFDADALDFVNRQLTGG
jgi:hypothetical protein